MQYSVHSYRFPRICARCSTCAATSSWPVAYLFQRRPDNDLERIHLLYVPICEQCRLAIKVKDRDKLKYLVASALILIVVTVGLAANLLTLSDAILAGSGAGLFISLLICFIIIWPNLDLRNGIEFCWVIDGKRMVFANSDYQKMFDKLNQNDIKSI